MIRIGALTRFVAAAFTAGLLLVSAASAEARRALVIAIDQYDELADLNTTLGDAAGYVDAFRSLGYDVQTLSGYTPVEELERVVGDLIAATEEGDQVAIVYSGHGISFENQVFMLPSDVPIRASSFGIKRSSISLQEDILANLNPRKPAFILTIIDACRENPFEGETRSGFDRGLTSVDVPEGTFLIYSAGERQLALDRLSANDPNRYSVFSRVFIPKLKAGRKSVEQMINETQEEVFRLASSVGHQQNPAYYDEAKGFVCLSDACGATDTEDVIWESGQGTCFGANYYLSLYPSGRYANEADALLRSAACAGGDAIAGEDETGVTPPAAGEGAGSASARGLSSDDPLREHQWYLAPFEAFIAASQSRGEGLVIADLSTGVNFAHPDLRGVTWLPGFDTVSSVRNAADGDGRDTDPADPGKTCRDDESSYFGTQMVGLMAAQPDNGEGIFGLVSDARILPMRVMSDCGGAMEDIADAIKWAAGVKALQTESGRYVINRYPADLINLPIGLNGACPAILQDAIDAATGKGIVVVAGSGNARKLTSEATPSSCRGMVIVAAADASGAISTYSNFGDEVAFMAPGGELGDRVPGAEERRLGILSTTAAGAGCASDASGLPCGYHYAQGASHAATLSTAAIALVLSRWPELEPGEAVQLIKARGVTPRTQLQCAGACEAYPGSTPIPDTEGICYRPCGTGNLNLARLADLDDPKAALEVARKPTGRVKLKPLTRDVTILPQDLKRQLSTATIERLQLQSPAPTTQVIQPMETPALTPDRETLHQRQAIGHEAVIIEERETE